MEDVIKADPDHKYVKAGIEAYKNIDNVDIKYDTLYKDVAAKVKDKLLARGFTTAMLYSSTEFSSEKTGQMSKVRAMLGKRDCYFTNPKMSDGKLFHDIYINLSYSYGVSDEKITNNSYALYALVRELSRLIPMRVFVVNHVGTDIPTCYSYVLKRFGTPINPAHFLFFTSASKRTFGWATYEILNKDNDRSAVGEPTNSVSIDKFSLDTEIDNIFEKVKGMAPELFKIK